MGNLFNRKKKNADFTPGASDEGVTITKKVDGIHEEFATELVKFEERQKVINDKAVAAMKEDFLNRPDYFVANLLCLSPQFYKHFDKERDEISKLVRDKEIEYDDKLAQYRRRIQFVGAHEVIAASHTLYKPQGVEYHEVSTYRQFYVIQDNVQLFSENEYNDLQSNTYSEVDGTSYRFCVETSSRHKGYVRLRCADINEGESRRNTYEDIYRTLPPVKENEPDPILDPRPLRRNSLNEDDKEALPYLGRRPSGVIPDNYLKNLSADMKAVGDRIEKAKKINGISLTQTEHILNGIKTQPPKVATNAKININDSAFKTLKDKLAEIDEDEEDLDHKEETPVLENTEGSVTSKDSDTDAAKSRLTSTIRKECFLYRKMRVKSLHDVYGLDKNENYDKRTYLSSEQYREMFEDDFDEFLKAVKKFNIIDKTVETPSIVTSEVYKKSLLIKTEYIPALSFSEWPECASEWRFRPRNQKADPDTRMIYRWPKQRHIEEIAEKHGCVLVPLGYYNPRNPSRVMLIEWQLQFVRAEQILLRSLGHQQIKVLLMIQLLFRDHVDKNKDRVLRPQHLRYVLFWLCEHNYRDWQDDRLAVKIKAYLKTLYSSLANGLLPHYFIRSANMLENIKEKNLRTVQEAIKRILENLPVYLMHTIQSLKTEDDFYPRMNINEVFKLCVAEKFGILQLNPSLIAAIPDEEPGILEDDDEEEQSQEHNELKHRLNRERERRKSVFIEQTGGAKEVKVVKSTGMDLTKKVAKLNDLRAEKLLTLFSNHFVDLAIYSNKFGNHPQANKYLYHAENMIDILLDRKMNCPQVIESEFNDLRERIQKERDVTRQGLNFMLNNSHRLTETLELKISHPPPRPNWELKKNRESMPKKDLQKQRNVSKLQKELQENPIKKVTTFPTKQTFEKNVSKSLSDLTEVSAKSMVVINDERTIKFEVASDDEDDSTDL